MTDINTLITKAGVVARSAVTWIAAAVAVIQFALVQSPLADSPEIVQYGGQAVAFLLGVIAIIRRVTPVDPQDRGLL